MNIHYEKRIFGLDLMRTCAILLVVISHANFINNYEQGLLTDLFSMAGLLGVEIFFVLSGFLIGRILFRLFVKENFSKQRLFYFWVRRWFRTLPNYYLILILNIFIALYIGYGLPENLWRYFFFVQNFVTEMPWFFGESWSLPIEEFAYILGPACLFFVFVFRSTISKSKLFLAVTLLIITFFISTKIAYNYFHPTTDMKFWNINLKAMTIYRIDAIYYGVLAAWLFYSFPVLWDKYKKVTLFIGSTIFLLIVLVIPMLGIFIQDFPFYWNVIYLPLLSIAIACMLPFLNALKTKGLLLLPITFISIVSYSMYLLHVSVVRELMLFLIPPMGLSKFQVLIYAIAYFSITLVLSYLLYRFFEKPITNLREHPKILNKIGVNKDASAFKKQSKF